MVRRLSITAAVKVYKARKQRDACTRLMHRAYVKLMLEAGPIVDGNINVYHMMASVLGKEMRARRASRNAALLIRSIPHIDTAPFLSTVYSRSI